MSDEPRRGSGQIPDYLDEWDTDTIDSLTKFVNSESETLEFKEEPRGLSREMSAFANTSGGFIVLGIAERESERPRFERVGFEDGKQDDVDLCIGNEQHDVEPLPTCEVKYVPHGSRFCAVIKIRNEPSKKPFMLKSRGQFFVRINGSARPAPRSTIMNLFGASLEYRRSVDHLRASCMLVNESIKNTATHLDHVHPIKKSRPAPVDLSLLKGSMVAAMGFVQENDLLGHIERTEQNTSTIHAGLTTAIDTLERLNEQIRAYNAEYDSLTAEEVGMINPAYYIMDDIRNAKKILDDVISKTEQFLSDYE